LDRTTQSVSKRPRIANPAGAELPRGLEYALTDLGVEAGRLTTAVAELPLF
jgi:hypothetical protein